jgi:tripartite-type tricarboxylate transporter receptor subunit TctC
MSLFSQGLSRLAGGGLRSAARFAVALSLTATLASPSAVQAQPAAAYPGRPITLIVPLDAGALMDNFSRTLAQGLSERLQQPIVVINRPGASEAIGVESVVRAAPDGYTLLVATQTGVVLNVGGRKDLSYDPRRDLAPISLLFSSPLWFVAPAELKAASVKDVVSLAKQSPGKLTFASIGVGSTLHLAGELFKIKTGVDILHVPYKGMGGALVDLLNNRIDLMFAGSGAAIPQIQSEKLRPLAVTSQNRSFVLPSVPTMVESGVPEFDVSTWLGAFAPRNTPAPIIERLNREIAAVLKTEAIDRRARQDSLEVAGSTPEQLGERIRREIPYWTDIIGKLQL